CSNWPRCTTTSIVPPASFHGRVEFANRALTVLITVVVVVTALAALRRQPRRRDLTLLAWSLVAGVLGQAVVGGLSVIYDLAPPWLMAHLLLSMLALWAALVLVHRANPAWRRRPPDASRGLAVPGRLLAP